MLAAVGLAAPAMADVWSWNTGNGSWMTASNWTPNNVPGINPLIYTDVRIGNLPGVQNSTVLLNHLVASGALPFDELHISSGMTLDTNGREIGGLNGIATLTGASSELIVRPSAGPNFHDFTTRDFTMGAGTLLNLADDGRIRTGYLTSSGVIFGRGTVHVQGIAPGASLVNNGTISGAGNGGLTILQEGSGRFDLDGTSGNGQLTPAAPFSQLTIQGDTLADVFGGTVTMGSGSLLNMNMSSGWTTDASSTFNVSSSIVGAAAQITGGHFTFGGDLNIGGSQGHLRVLANTTLTPTTDVSLGMDDRLEFDGATTVQGGTYSFAGGLAAVEFNGPTTMQGGTFNMSGPLISNGRVDFNGNTTWDGTVNINGLGRQNGDATVAGPTVINAGRFVMQGYSDNTVWNVSNSLTVNADRINTASNFFSGTMNITGGALGRVTINLSNPSEAWYMLGTMNLAGAGGLPVTRVAGSHIVVGGNLNINSGIVQITADTTLASPLGPATVNIAPGATLRTRGATTVEAPTIFAGSGTLQNGVGGSMLLDTGVSLSNVGLANSGILRIGEAGPGVAAVDRLTSAIGATWGVDIAGYLAGADHDLLLVTGGGASLAGVINVWLLGLGGGPIFAPNIGDEFTILSALGGVSGVFSNDPVTQVGGLTYDWTVIYNPNTVVLRLDNVVPAPGSIALLGLGSQLAARRRRA